MQQIVNIGLRCENVSTYSICRIKVRLRWFGADLVKPLYRCNFSGDLHVLYVK